MAAIYGQLAGAFYGESGIPVQWRRTLAHKSLLDRFAETLFQLSHGGPPDMGQRNIDAKEQAEELLKSAGGDAEKAHCRLFDEESEIKRETGIVAYLGGPMHLQAVHAEVLLQLRVALGLALVNADADPR